MSRARSPVAIAPGSNHQGEVRNLSPCYYFCRFLISFRHLKLLFACHQAVRDQRETALARQDKHQRLPTRANACHPIEPFPMDACAQSGRRLSREIHFQCSLLAGKSGGVHPTTMPAINPTQIEKRESINITKCLPSSPIMFSWAGQFASSVSTSHRVHQQGPLASSILPF